MREEIKVNNNISNYYPQMSNYNQNEFEVSLKDWFREGHSEEEYRNLFVYMSLAMKYIHDQGRYVASFSLDKIKLVHGSIQEVKFEDIEMFPSDINNPDSDDYGKKREIIKSNILYSSILQIYAYTGLLEQLPYFNDNSLQFLKNNFNEYVIYLPDSDVAYYRGVIERGASVYLHAYVDEKMKRDVGNLEKEVGGDGVDYGKSKVLSTGKSLLPNNEEINRSIYDFSGKYDAFARALIYPILIFILGLVILFLLYFQ